MIHIKMHGNAVRDVPNVVRDVPAVCVAARGGAARECRRPVQRRYSACSRMSAIRRQAVPSP